MASWTYWFMDEKRQPSPALYPAWSFEPRSPQGPRKKEKPPEADVMPLTSAWGQGQRCAWSYRACAHQGVPRPYCATDHAHCRPKTFRQLSMRLSRTSRGPTRPRATALPDRGPWTFFNEIPPTPLLDALGRVEDIFRALTTQLILKVCYY